MRLVIDNKVITEPIINILKQVRAETGFTLYNDIQDKGDNLMVCCPRHKNGIEKHPSCSVLNTDTDPNVPIGWHHCFTCGLSLPLEAVIGECFGRDVEFGKEWLKDHYGNVFIDRKEVLPEINFNKSTQVKKYIDESVLREYEYYHDYMWERKLTKEVVDKYEVGYDPQRMMLTFPVRDEKGNLCMITARSTQLKMFHIDKNIEKPVYLLYYMLKDNVKTVYVCEGQLDALTACSYGYPCVATMGGPSAHQISILNRCGIRNMITVFDNDEAGYRFTQVFNKSISKDILVSNFSWQGIDKKDINDFSEEEFTLELEKQGLSFKYHK